MANEVSGAGGKPIGASLGGVNTPQDVEGKFLGHSVTLKSSSESVLGEAEKNVPLPTTPEPKQIGARAESQDADKSEDTGDADSKESKEDLKEKKELKEKKVSDVDASEKDRREQGLMKRLKQMMEAKRIKSYYDIIDASKEEFSDVTEAYDALANIEQNLFNSETSSDKKLAGSINKAKADFLKNEGPQIRAGWMFGTGNETVDNHRKFVQDSAKSVGEAFFSAMEQVGGDEKAFDELFDSVLSSAAKDLAAPVPTMEPNLIIEAQKKLKNAHQAKNLKRECEYLLKSMANLHGIGPYTKTN